MVDWRIELLRAKKYENILEDTYQFDPPLGWGTIVRGLLDYINWHNKLYKSNITLWTCTKQNGGLRFHIDTHGADREAVGEVYGAIQFAEMIATTQCERCGSAGELRKFQLEDSLELTTLCDKHHKEAADAVCESLDKN
jgi:hypothetical protein